LTFRKRVLNRSHAKEPEKKKEDLNEVQLGALQTEEIDANEMQ
jgi:hypothetical protein